MNHVKIQEISTELLVEHPENSNFMNAETARKLRRHIEREKQYTGMLGTVPRMCLVFPDDLQFYGITLPCAALYPGGNRFAR